MVYKRCTTCNTLHYTFTNKRMYYCRRCGNKLVSIQERNIRELLNKGYKEEVRYIMSRHIGKVPLCNVIRRGDKIHCYYINNYMDIDKFSKACLLCQEEIACVLFQLNENKDYFKQPVLYNERQ